MSSAPEPDRLSFAELQAWFLEQIVAPHRKEMPVPGKAPERAVGEVILPSRTLNPEQRIGIYSSMYLLRIIEVMESEHPVVARLMGTDAFADLVRDYVNRFPPRSFTVHSLPHALPYYLRHHCKRDDAPLLTDIARLERAVSDAFDTHSAGTLSAESLAEIPADAWGEVRFRMDPCVRVLAFDHDACAIVNAHHDGKELPDLGPRSSWAVVWRHNYVIWRRPVSQIMYTILSSLAAGETITTALEHASEVWTGDDSELENKIFQWFAGWLNDGFFSSYSLHPR